MGKATDDALRDLHGLLAKEFAARIKSGEAPAAILKEAREFLKDNKIESLATPGSALQSIADSLPFAGSGDYPN